MSTENRLCLRCHKPFNSTSPSNRFCKLCKKKQRKLKGAFMSLDTSAIPPSIASAIGEKYYTEVRAARVVYKSETEPPPAYRTIILAEEIGSYDEFTPPTPPEELWEWGPPYPEGM